MKYLDSFLVICAFALSTIMTAALFAACAAWAYGALDQSGRDVIAQATSGLRTAEANATVPAGSAEAGIPVVRLETVTVIGHRHELDGGHAGQIARADTSSVN